MFVGCQAGKHSRLKHSDGRGSANKHCFVLLTRGWGRWARGKRKGFSPGAAACHRSRTRVPRILSFFGRWYLSGPFPPLLFFRFWDPTSPWLDTGGDRTKKSFSRRYRIFFPDIFGRFFRNRTRSQFFFLKSDKDSGCCSVICGPSGSYFRFKNRTKIKKIEIGQLCMSYLRDRTSPRSEIGQRMSDLRLGGNIRLKPGYSGSRRSRGAENIVRFQKKRGKKGKNGMFDLKKSPKK